MFEEIKTIVAENLGVEEDSITMESSFKDDLKADSLDLFEMVMALEENYVKELFQLRVILKINLSFGLMSSIETNYL